MSDLNWCTYCDSAIGQNSSSLYCSEKCLREDALHCHPLLGYKYPEFKNFPRVRPLMTSSDQQLTTFTKKPADDQHFRLAIVSPKNHKQSHHYFNTMMIQ